MSMQRNRPPTQRLPYGALRQRAETGMVCLVAGDTPVDRVIQHATRSPSVHLCWSKCRDHPSRPPEIRPIRIQRRQSSHHRGHHCPDQCDHGREIVRR